MAGAVNTDALLDASARVRAMAAQLSDGADELLLARRDLEPWEGRAAQACDERLRAESARVDGEVHRLEAIAEALRRFAEEMRAADSELADDMVR